MNVRCQSCSTTYRVDPAKVPSAGVRARCVTCGAVFLVTRGAATAGVAPSDGGATARTPSVPSSPAPAPRQPQQRAASGPERPATPAPSSGADAAATRAPSPPTRPMAPVVAPVARPTVPPAAQPRRPAPPRPVATLPPPAIPGMRPPVSTRPQSSPVPAPLSPSPAVATPTPRPVNPFLASDPSQKARRLARALVSDMVAYHPAKRREALRTGTLRTAFEEEIGKSWEEYVDQVGRELAESTTHFTDALNEILADGQQVF